MMERDLRLISTMASVITRFPGMRWLSLDEAANEFCALMQTQLDLRTEGRNLAIFRDCFSGRGGLTFPEKIDMGSDLGEAGTEESILVMMSFEA